MEVGVDEARPHDMAGGIHRLGTFEWLFADLDDATVFDADIGDVVEQCFRVHDPAVVDDEVVVLGKGRRNGQKTCRQEYADAGRNIHGLDGSFLGVVDFIAALRRGIEDEEITEFDMITFRPSGGRHP